MPMDDVTVAMSAFWIESLETTCLYVTLASAVARPSASHEKDQS